MSKKDKVIVKLVMQNEKYKKKVDILKSGYKDIYNDLICVGGPFNDNKLNFTSEQLKYLRGIYRISEEFEQ